MSNNILELESRNKIFDFILNNPGIHISDMCKNLNIPRSTLVYHLNFLVKRHILKTEADGKYIRYYIAKYFGKHEQEIMSFLRRKTLFEIILIFMHCGVASQKEISLKLDKKPATICSHLKKLKGNYIIEEVSRDIDNIFKTKTQKQIIRSVRNREIIYRLKDPELIYFTILKNKKSFLKDKNSNLIFGNITYYIQTGVPKKRKYFKDEVDLIEKTFYEIFPHPYHM